MDSIVLRNNIPIINYNSNQLTKTERKLSKFFKCLPNSSEKCLWTGNDCNKYRKHLEKHKNVFCFYCKHNANNENIESFDSKQYNQLIQHLVQRHGFRRFQCNQCQYRAVTATHLELHQISAHYNIWSNNSFIDSFDAINKMNDSLVIKICKIIVCKNICFGPSVHHSIWMKEFAPHLDSIGSQYHCLFCDYSDAEVVKVFIHCVQSHPDFDVCVWHKGCDNYSVQSFNESSKYIYYDCDNESNDSISVLSKPSPKRRKSICIDFEGKDIPGLEHNFKPPLRRESYDYSYDDDYDMTPLDDNFSLSDKISDPEEYSQQSVSENRYETHERGPQMQPNINLNQNNVYNNSINSRNSNNHPIKRSVSHSDILSAKPSSNSTTSPTIPPPIDLHEMESQLSAELSSPIRQNSFKQKKRVGVSRDVPQNTPSKSKTTPSKANKISYVKRMEKENEDEYIELINETLTPKKGVKARFENRTFFEPTALSKTRVEYKDKNIFRCLICNIDDLRINKIDYHLNSVHNTQSSFKCGYCEFIDNKFNIREHSRLKHPSNEDKIEKFIVPKSQETAIGFTSSSKIVRPVDRVQATARKRTGGPLIRGSITQKIKESTFMGPLRNDITVRKRQLESERVVENEPFIRVKPRMTHSSDIKTKKVVEPKHNQVAKKSTAKGGDSSQKDSQIFITDEEIPTKYFCVFCSESFIINNKVDAIEHYKLHLNLGYTCAKCKYFVISYDQMEYHINTVHPNEEIDFEDNMTEPMMKWISNFLDNQIKNSDFVGDDMPSNNNSINIECPLCLKSSLICKMKARPFDALWKAKLHVCKHYYWMPMRCKLCVETETYFPINPYLLMKHLVDQHFTSADNIHNISFRGQKAYNDLKEQQLRTIDKNYVPLRVHSSEIIDAFFYQLMVQLDVIYEQQLKLKFGLSKEIRISSERMVHIKSEPIDENAELISSDDDCDDKKDIKREIKTELKSKIKPEVKDEVKDEMKEEDNEETNKTQKLLGLLYPDECITLSSDDES